MFNQSTLVGKATSFTGKLFCSTARSIIHILILHSRATRNRNICLLKSDFSRDLKINVTFAWKMVRLHVKKGDESQFLYDTSVEARVDDVIQDVTVIYNGRLKISRICYGKTAFFILMKTFFFN